MRTNNIGMVGLAVMGRSLALNMADHGYKVGGYNRSYAVTEHMLEAWPHENFTGYSTLEELVASLEKPRKVMLMVKAGKAVDALIEQLIPLLEQGDIILDGGNSFFEDTIRREAYLKGKGLHYFGVGISGGEDGARFGPSIMPGGNKAAYEEIRTILEAVAARAEDGTPCCTYIGENGAGHYVKMVHNGIEYADMQLIAEAYLLLKHVGHFDNAQLAEIFSEYQKGELNSFLIHITSDIFREQDDKSGKELVDCIRDAAQQKGTGRWTSIEALKQGVDVSMIAAAGNTRVMSNNENRKAAEKQYPHVEIAEISNPDAFKEEVRQGLYAAKIIAYAQGFDLLKQASASYGWELPLGKIASIFRAGCIIQAKFLNDITRAYEQQADLSHLLLDSFFQERVVSYEKNLRQIGAQAILSGIPVPAMANAISYLDLFCATHVGANLIQAQRDYFGAHTFERVDEEGSFHHEWRRWA